ncbi:hypothetical protein V8G54_033526 [Vigna mungo]|uniref:Uncharacterized protein n=1 Tax=Vigna mungo TaxID=3915 RepID=A0AAQ3RJ24_VIGMU
MESGMEPEKELEARERFVREIRSPREEGISPARELEERLRSWRESSMVMEGGMLPLRRLLEKSMKVRLEWRWPGRDPVRLALEMVRVLSLVMWARMTKGPEALIWPPETVREVRFWSWESQTPEMRRKPLMEEKEVREEASSGGRRTGERGQLRRERERRVERDLRAVKERER